jgi:hypothetical protein
MLNTKNMSVGSGKTKPVISVGNQTVKLNSIVLEATPYDQTAFNVILNVESKPIEGEFEGFLIDPTKPNLGRYQGQVGRVKMGPYPYKDTTLPNGREIKRDDEILKGMVFLSEALGKREELDSITASTIEQFIFSCNKLLSSGTYFNVCIGGREWENKEGYINHDLFLPRISKDGVPLEALNVEKSRLLMFNKDTHIVPIKKKDTPVSNFESPFAANDDFDL